MSRNSILMPQGVMRLKTGRFGYNSNRPQICLTEIEALHITQLSFFPDQIRALKLALKKQFNLPDMPHQDSIIKSRSVSAVRPEINKIWLFSSSPVLVDLPASMGKYFPLDLSASRVGIKISGSCAQTLINRFAALDLTSDKSCFMSSCIHHVQTHILKINSEEFLVFVPRSFSESIGHSLFDVACQFGIKVAPVIPYKEI